MTKKSHLLLHKIRQIQVIEVFMSEECTIVTDFAGSTGQYS
jgi:hypothetical protein